MMLDPVLFNIGPVKIYWYGISYIVGILLATQYSKWLIDRFSLPFSRNILDFFVPQGLIFMILGGRLAHVIFYEPMYYLDHPFEIIMTWKGGMSFHGGLAGVMLAWYLFARKNNLNILAFLDLLAQITPIGLAFGRVANFVNQELYGIPTNLPWGIVFERVDYVTRHPTQLYEAFGEGVVLLILLYILRVRNVAIGVISGVFAIGYGIIRCGIELLKDDTCIMGQLLCIPLIILGLFLLYNAYNNKKTD